MRTSSAVGAMGKVPTQFAAPVEDKPEAGQAPRQAVRRMISKVLERVKGIEPSSSAWKAVALPLSYTRTRNKSQSSVVSQQKRARNSDH
jgi:hypothetical protein